MKQASADDLPIRHAQGSPRFTDSSIALPIVTLDLGYFSLKTTFLQRFTPGTQSSFGSDIMPRASRLAVWKLHAVTDCEGFPIRPNFGG